MINSNSIKIHHKSSHFGDASASITLFPSLDQGQVMSSEGPHPVSLPSQGANPIMRSSRHNMINQIEAIRARRARLEALTAKLKLPPIAPAGGAAYVPSSSQNIPLELSHDASRTMGLNDSHTSKSFELNNSMNSKSLGIKDTFHSNKVSLNDSQIWRRKDSVRPNSPSVQPTSVMAYKDAFNLPALGLSPMTPYHNPLPDISREKLVEEDESNLDNYLESPPPPSFESNVQVSQWVKQISQEPAEEMQPTPIGSSLDNIKEQHGEDLHEEMTFRDMDKNLPFTQNQDEVLTEDLPPVSDDLNCKPDDDRDDDKINYEKDSILGLTLFSDSDTEENENESNGESILRNISTNHGNEKENDIENDSILGLTLFADSDSEENESNTRSIDDHDASDAANGNEQTSVVEMPLNMQFKQLGSTDNLDKQLVTEYEQWIHDEEQYDEYMMSEMISNIVHEHGSKTNSASSTKEIDWGSTNSIFAESKNESLMDEETTSNYIDSRQESKNNSILSSKQVEWERADSIFAGSKANSFIEEETATSEIVPVKESKSNSASSIKQKNWWEADSIFEGSKPNSSIEELFNDSRTDSIFGKFTLGIANDDQNKHNSNLGDRMIPDAGLSNQTENNDLTNKVNNNQIREMNMSIKQDIDHMPEIESSLENVEATGGTFLFQGDSSLAFDNQYNKQNSIGNDSGIPEELQFLDKNFEGAETIQEGTFEIPVASPCSIGPSLGWSEASMLNESVTESVVKIKLESRIDDIESNHFQETPAKEFSTNIDQHHDGDLNMSNEHKSDDNITFNKYQDDDRNTDESMKNLVNNENTSKAYQPNDDNMSIESQYDYENDFIGNSSESSISTDVSAYRESPRLSSENSSKCWE